MTRTDITAPWAMPVKQPATAKSGSEANTSMRDLRAVITFSLLGIFLSLIVHAYGPLDSRILKAHHAPTRTSEQAVNVSGQKFTLRAINTPTAAPHGDAGAVKTTRIAYTD